MRSAHSSYHYQLSVILAGPHVYPRLHHGVGPTALYSINVCCPCAVSRPPVLASNQSTFDSFRIAFSSVVHVVKYLQSPFSSFPPTVRHSCRAHAAIVCPLLLPSSLPHVYLPGLRPALTPVMRPIPEPTRARISPCAHEVTGSLHF
jgi:hypothetical protein